MNSAMSGTDTSGLVIVDAGVVIGHLDRSHSHHRAATRALSQAASRAERLMLPVTAFAECLVYPAQAGEEATRRFEAALTAILIGILDADIRSAIAKAVRQAD